MVEQDIFDTLLLVFIQCVFVPRLVSTVTTRNPLGNHVLGFHVPHGIGLSTKPLVANGTPTYRATRPTLVF